MASHLSAFADEEDDFEADFSSLSLAPRFAPLRKVSPTGAGTLNLVSVHSRKGGRAMGLELLRTAPAGESFTPLAVHQEQTPASFYGGKAVLHYSCSGARLVITRGDLAAAPGFAAMSSEDPSSNGDSNAVNGSTTTSESGAGAVVVLSGIDAWITNERVVLFSSAKSAGVAIPYQDISLHATRRLKLPSSAPDCPEVQGLYMQITIAGDDSEEEGQIHVTLVPSSTTDGAAQSTTSDRNETQTTAIDGDIQALFSAVTTCSNLNPDPQVEPSSDDEGGFGDNEALSSIGGLPPAMPGSGGWITSENVGDFFDDNGEPRTEAFDTEAEETRVTQTQAGQNPSDNTEEGQGGLGAGAGYVRPRGDDEEIDWGDDNDADGDGAESKWRRTD
ncbi:MAG: hypothetical protein M1835_004472 [Candelina submexicana]|nr:MAG: hypothetical protein M1835_004472 [Candelina submexicana]